MLNLTSNKNSLHFIERKRGCHEALNKRQKNRVHQMHDLDTRYAWNYQISKLINKPCEGLKIENDQ